MSVTPELQVYLFFSFTPLYHTLSLMLPTSREWALNAPLLSLWTQTQTELCEPHAKGM